MARPTKTVDDHSWEKEYAAKASRGRVISIGAMYLLWIGFLAYLAADRWFGSLQ